MTIATIAALLTAARATFHLARGAKALGQVATEQRRIREELAVIRTRGVVTLLPGEEPATPTIVRGA